MTIHRCGLTDAAFAREYVARWGKKTLRWHLGTPLPSVGAEIQGAILADAFSGWEAVCGIRTEHTADPRQAEIVIGCGRGRRADFDGPGNVLAWAHLPSSPAFDGQLQLMFDIDEDWQQIKLLNVAAHEFGHNLGISHGPTGCLMAAVYSAAIARPKAWDIAEATARYGASPPVTPQPNPSGAPKKIAVEMADGKIYVASIFAEAGPKSTKLVAPWLGE